MLDTTTLNYQLYREGRRKRIINSKLSSSDYYNCKSTTEYNKRKNRKQKQIIDEINRLNLTSDYGV